MDELRYDPSVDVEEKRETTKTSQDRRYPSLDCYRLVVCERHESIPMIRAGLYYVFLPLTSRRIHRQAESKAV
jgi:hypothetical protein